MWVVLKYTIQTAQYKVGWILKIVTSGNSASMIWSDISGGLDSMKLTVNVLSELRRVILWERGIWAEVIATELNIYSEESNETSCLF